MERELKTSLSNILAISDISRTKEESRNSSTDLKDSKILLNLFGDYSFTSGLILPKFYRMQYYFQDKKK